MGWPKRTANNIPSVAVIVISNQTAAPSMAQLQQQMIGSATRRTCEATVRHTTWDFGFRGKRALVNDLFRMTRWSPCDNRWMSTETRGSDTPSS
jgi:hypothetical protein